MHMKKLKINRTRNCQHHSLQILAPSNDARSSAGIILIIMIDIIFLILMVLIILNMLTETKRSWICRG